MTPDSRYALGTFSIAGASPFAGLVLDESVIALSALQPVARSLGCVLSGTGINELLESWDSNAATLKSLVAALRTPAGAAALAHAVPVAQLRVHAPLLPRQIFCCSANYRKHVIDLILDRPTSVDPGVPLAERRQYAEALMDHRALHGKPYAFLKLPSCVTGPFDDVPLPFDMTQPDWELELGAVIGKTARRVPQARALGYVAGYVIGNDLTAREMLARPDIPGLGADWLSAKCAPGFLPLGPYLVPAEFVPDPQNLQITLKLNGKTMQDESTSDMIFNLARLIEWLSTQVELQPGDLVMTGSPSGNGTHYNRYLQPGDVMDGSITGLGTQRNTCVTESLTDAQRAVRYQKPEKVLAAPTVQR
jgi:2-keto-4-pentenoate hydratase/2-oxohepta-3-ene-1,7-dioic acid hydratase in catechol pathway